jgi:VIT1/CCC1 family predicted Fe2+/Mn2+ transporter
MTKPSGSITHDVGDHLAEARENARSVLAGETHLGHVDDWRQAILSARDAAVFTLIVWVVLRGSGGSDHLGRVLLAAGLGFSLYRGIAASVATRVRLRHFEDELARERREIKEQPEHEREEVLALYAAKGFREPLLSQVTDVLCEDEDRLLKVMMEEELGLFIQHMNHPLLVGIWNAFGAAVGTVFLAVPLCVRPMVSDWAWMAVAGGEMLLLSTISAWFTRRPVVPLVTGWFAMSAVAVGATYFVTSILFAHGAAH